MKSRLSPSIYIVMGVSGSGKTTIGELLAKELELPYFDGDNYHPTINVKKMADGHPLSDEDRQDWLIALNTLALNNSNKGAVIACSALKEQYRNVLRKSLEETIHFIYLDGSFELIQKRMEAREGHFMPVDLLKSQFKTLEPPKNAIWAPINNNPEGIMLDIIQKLNKN